MEYFELNNGYKIPVICYGPGMLSRGMRQRTSFLGRVENKVIYKYKEVQYYKIILYALQNGCRFIDYSASYGHENLIAKAIKASKLKRDDIILTTRIPNSAQFSGNVREAFFQSLRSFNTDYIDVLMFHWPVTECYLSTWKEMIKLRDEGYCKIIGVANCHAHHLEFLIENTGVIPAINQVEIHPLFTQKELLHYCQRNKIVIEAYTPLARFDDRLIRLPLLKAIANKYNKTIAQIILRWHIDNGVVPVFRSMSKKRLLENYNIFDFSLTEEEIKSIDSVNINSRLRYDPDNCDFTIL